MPILPRSLPGVWSFGSSSWTLSTSQASSSSANSSSSELSGVRGLLFCSHFFAVVTTFDVVFLFLSVAPPEVSTFRVYQLIFFDLHVFRFWTVFVLGPAFGKGMISDGDR